ncbi:YcaO-like family protein [Natronobiforma cellulositropha]|uniref:YcaO-like family protein n=1 Tax=Natronobiforma cellulositropha TaxID=1679076 RepID=UPI0021D5CCAE|nr:YcaO-like family protein [Natronobiforma cellulositropha]
MRCIEHVHPVPPQFYRAVGEKTGVLNTLFFKTVDRGDPVAYQTATSRCDLEYLLEFDGELDFGVSGKGANLGASLTSCIGEALERFSLCWPDTDTMRRTSYDELVRTDRAAEFEYLDEFSDEFRERFLAPFSRETELLWEPGVDLLTGENVYVPAEYVWNRVGPLTSEPTHLLGSSNGVAAAPTLQEAVLWALLEHVERDGIMRTWWTQTVPNQVDVDALPWLREAIDERLPRADLSVRLFECESIVDVPVYGSALVSERDTYPTFVMAGAAALDPDEALREAALEAMQGWPYLHDIAVQYDAAEIQIDEVVDDFTQNIVYYAHPDNFDDVSFLLDGPLTTPTEPNERAVQPDEEWTAGQQLEYLLGLLEDAGCTPIAFDVTAPDVRQCGTHVARVFVPELVRLIPPAAVPARHPAFEGVEITEKPHPYP